MNSLHAGDPPDQLYLFPHRGDRPKEILVTNKQVKFRTSQADGVRFESFGRFNYTLLSAKVELLKINSFSSIVEFEKNTRFGTRSQKQFSRAFIGLLYIFFGGFKSAQSCVKIACKSSDRPTEKLDQLIQVHDFCQFNAFMNTFQGVSRTYKMPQQSSRTIQDFQDFYEPC